MSIQRSTTSTQRVESWILRHAVPADSGLRYAGRVVAGTGVGALALALFTIAVHPSALPAGIGIWALLVNPYRGVFASAVVFAWVAAAALALPVLWGRRVYASGVFVLVIACTAVLISEWLDGPPSPWIAVATYPVALIASRFVPILNSPVRARGPV